MDTPRPIKRALLSVSDKTGLLDFAKKFGATDLINASEYDPVEKIIEITDGGVDFSFDAIGIKIQNESIKKNTTKSNKSITEEDAWEIMKTCYDPEIPVNIVDLGLIYDLNMIH